MNKHMYYPVGARARDRIAKARAELQNLRDVLEAESVKVKTMTEFDEEAQKEVLKKKSFIDIENSTGDIRIKKKVSCLVPTRLPPR